MLNILSDAVRSFHTALITVVFVNIISYSISIASYVAICVQLIGGPLTITDANLCLGRLLPEYVFIKYIYMHGCVYVAICVCRYFPKIFGPNEDQPLDKEMTIREFEKLTSEVIELLFYILCSYLAIYGDIQVYNFAWDTMVS